MCDIYQYKLSIYRNFHSIIIVIQYWLFGCIDKLEWVNVAFPICIILYLKAIIRSWCELIYWYRAIIQIFNLWKFIVMGGVWAIINRKTKFWPTKIEYWSKHKTPRKYPTIWYSASELSEGGMEHIHLHTSVVLDKYNYN